MNTRATKFQLTPRHRLRIIVALVFYFFVTTTLLPSTFSGTVVRVLDGDTIDIFIKSKIIRVRFAGAIDCPELDQPHGDTAKKFVENILLGKYVHVLFKGKDNYGRIIGRVFLNRVDISYELVRLGLAWHRIEFNKELKLISAFNHAKSNKLGIWSQPFPTPPWFVRKFKNR